MLERGAVGETWRSSRWDGFFLNTPNWSLQLPGGEYGGDEPDAFAPLGEAIAYLEDYARSFSAPVRERVDVRALRRRNDRYVVETARRRARGAQRRRRDRRLPAAPSSRAGGGVRPGRAAADDERVPPARAASRGRRARRGRGTVGLPDRRRALAGRAQRVPRGRALRLVPPPAPGARLRLLGARGRAPRRDGGLASLAGRTACVQPADLGKRRRPRLPSTLARRARCGRRRTFRGSATTGSPASERESSRRSQRATSSQTESFLGSTATSPSTVSTLATAEEHERGPTPIADTPDARPPGGGSHDDPLGVGLPTGLRMDRPRRDGRARLAGSTPGREQLPRSLLRGRQLAPQAQVRALLRRRRGRRARRDDPGRTQLDRDREPGAPLAGEDAVEGLDARRVEHDARTFSEKCHRALVRPGGSVDPGRDERVVYVADRQDPDVEREVTRLPAIRIPAPVEPLVMASDELVNGRREAAELVQERDSRRRRVVGRR